MEQLTEKEREETIRAYRNQMIEYTDRWLSAEKDGLESAARYYLNSVEWYRKKINELKQLKLL